MKTCIKCSAEFIDIGTVILNRADTVLLSKLLGLLPGAKPRHEIKIDATRFGDNEWNRLMDMYAGILEAEGEINSGRS